MVTLKPAKVTMKANLIGPNSHNSCKSVIHTLSITFSVYNPGPPTALISSSEPLCHSHHPHEGSAECQP